MVTEGRAEGQDDMLEQGKLRAQPKTRENSKEVQNTERALLAGDKVPKYDVSILVRVSFMHGLASVSFCSVSVGIPIGTLRNGDGAAGSCCCNVGWRLQL